MPVFVILFIVLCVCGIIGGWGFLIYKAISTHVRNNNSPVETYNAVVVAKRAHVSGGGNDSAASTSYHVTFELEDNTRLELRVRAREYGVMAEGDRGVLTRQGTRFLGFERKSDVYEAADPNNAVHKCEACGATFRGRVCEYCGTPASDANTVTRRRG